jgi:hypothetical protein
MGPGKGSRRRVAGPLNRVAVTMDGHHDPFGGKISNGPSRPTATGSDAQSYRLRASGQLAGK